MIKYVFISKGKSSNTGNYVSMYFDEENIIVFIVYIEDGINQEIS